VNIAFLIVKTGQTVFGFCLCLVFLREILPLFGKKTYVFEVVVKKLTRPIWFLSDCVCRMMGIPLDHGGIEMRYPVALTITALAMYAVTGFGVNVRYG